VPLGPFDYHATFSSTPLQFFEGIYSRLLRPRFWDAPYDELVPDLAEGFTTSPDGKGFTFRLRQGVKFHDGQPVTSTDVKWSIDRARGGDPAVAAQNKVLLASVNSVDTVYPSTVTVTLSRASPSVLAWFGTAYAVIMPAHIVAPGTKVSTQEHLIGTGPFVLESFGADAGSKLVRNSGYFEPGVPYLEALQNIVIRDAQTQVASLRTGRIHFAGFGSRGLTFDELARLQNEVPGFVELKHRFGAGSIIGLFNPTVPPFNDVRVRRAVQLAIDQKEIIDLARPGRATPAGTLYTDTWALPQAEVDAWPGRRGITDADRREARQLLAQAGFSSGFSLRLPTQTVGTYQEEATVVAAQLAKIGITATIDAKDQASYYNLEITGAFQFTYRYFCSSDPAGTGDPEFGLQPFITGGLCNVFKLSDARIDRLYAQQLETADVAKRVPAVLEAQRLLLNDLRWVLPVYLEIFLNGFRPEVKGYSPAVGEVINARNIMRWDRVWLDR